MVVSSYFFQKKVREMYKYKYKYRWNIHPSHVKNVDPFHVNQPRNDYVTITNTTGDKVIATWSISWMDQNEEDTFSRSKALDPGEAFQHQGMLIANEYRYITRVGVKTMMGEKECEVNVERPGEQVNYDVAYILEYGKCAYRFQ
jgi:hypothetical protein